MSKSQRNTVGQELECTFVLVCELMAACLFGDVRDGLSILRDGLFLLRDCGVYLRTGQAEIAYSGFASRHQGMLELIECSGNLAEPIVLIGRPRKQKNAFSSCDASLSVPRS